MPPFKRRKKAGAHLQPNGEDKQNQPKLFDKVHNVVIDRKAKMPY